MSARIFRVLTRILRRDVNNNPSPFDRRIVLTSNIHGLSKCLCNDVSLEKQMPQSVELTPAVPEMLKPKKQIKLEEMTLNLQDFADEYPILQSLIDLGVEIYRYNRDQSLCRFLLKLDFDKDIKPYLIFLYKNGVPEDRLAEYLTKNPYIIQCDFDDLNVRINYLESKKFSKVMISHIITENPQWLIRPVEHIDTRLGEIQQALKLSGDQIRSLAVAFPKVVSLKKLYLRLNMFTFKEEFGITLKECQNLILKEPRLLKTKNDDLVKTFHYLSYSMNIPVHLILEHPKVLKCRVHHLRNRHMFLQRLGRAQYNPKLPGFVSLTDLTTISDEEFCQRIARSSLEIFHNFLKTF